MNITFPLPAFSIVNGPHYRLEGKSTAAPMQFLKSCILYAVGARYYGGLLAKKATSDERLATVVYTLMETHRLETGIECEIINQTLKSALSKEIPAAKACKRISMTGALIIDMLCLDETTEGTFEGIHRIMLEADPGYPAMVRLAQVIPGTPNHISDSEWWSEEVAKHSPIVRWIPIFEQ